MSFELLERRRSVRRFRPEIPPRELVEELVRAATLAPSASNSQPWRFLAVTRREVIDEMAAAVRSAVGSLTAAAEPAFAPGLAAYGKNFSWFATAPMVVLPLCRAPLSLTPMLPEGFPEEARLALEKLERSAGLMSVAMAVENLLLAAPVLGLGATVMTGPLLAEPSLREILAVRPGWELVAMVPVGYPDEEPEATPRKGVGQVIRWVD